MNLTIHIQIILLATISAILETITKIQFLLFVRSASSHNAYYVYIQNSGIIN